MILINSGFLIDTDEDCALELGRTFHDEGLDQVADVPSVANVLLSQADYDRLLNAAKLVRFLDDPAAMPELTMHIDTDGSEYFACTYRDPFMDRGGCEYADTPSEALAAALRTIKHYRTLAESKEAA
jgi:hypothetical protein